MFIMLLIFLLFIIIILTQVCSNYDLMENMTDNYNKYLNNQTSELVRNNLYAQNETIEITSLPICNKNILVDYGININSINNDGITINQIINDPLMHTIEVDNKNYNLVQIEWRKTNFSFNNNPIGLTLHLIHSDFNNLEKLIIIIPLDFVDDTGNIETFKNVFYNKMDDFFTVRVPQAINTEVKKFSNLDDTLADIGNSFFDIGNITEKTNNLKGKFKLSIKYKRKYDIKNINTDSLIKNQNEIPIYQCCKNTIGPTIHMNLCLLKSIIESNETFYNIKEENGNINLITEPNFINENYGLLIRSYIEQDENLLYLK
jgi:hypothetical protein